MTPKIIVRRIMTVLMLLAALSWQQESVRAEMWPGAENWQIDEQYGFSIGILPTQEKVEGSAGFVEPLGFCATFAADITNITYLGFKGMGFRLPEVKDADKKNFFIKLYRFPEKLKHFRVVGPVPEEFAINKVTGGSEISTFMASKKNLLVKKGFIDSTDRKFSAANPFPPLQVKDASQREHTEFINAIVFYSIYLKPEGRPELMPANAEPGTAEYSMQGVAAFHRDLIGACEKDLKSLKGPDDGYRYFLKKFAPPRMQVLKVMKNPLMFKDNWQNLPMPQGATKFLSSLLLLVSEEYQTAGADVAAPEEVDTPAFNSLWKSNRKTIFEVGSIFDNSTSAQK